MLRRLSSRNKAFMPGRSTNASSRGILIRCLLSITFLNATLLAQNFRPIGYLSEGNSHPESNYLQAFDGNNDGYPEFYYFTREPSPSSSAFTRICEYRPYNQYISADTIMSREFQAIGEFDGDNMLDLLAIGGYLYFFEQTFPDSYPTCQVWKSDSSYAIATPYHVADLDQDGKMDFLFAGNAALNVYENIGDNNYDLVWRDDTTSLGGWRYISGDFDQDGRMEWVTGSLYPYPCSVVYECVDDNQYNFTFCDTIFPSTANSHDVWFGNDLDQDGKLEFLIGSSPASGSFWAYQFRVYEAVADNMYEVIYTSDIVYCPFNLTVGVRSYCGDVDLDGQGEIIWAVQDNWYIYKAYGNNNFQRIFTAYSTSNGRDHTGIYVYDLNGNGYPEIIESGNINATQGTTETIIWEIEAVRLLYPNGGEVFNPGDTVSVTWQTFDPPGCDSLSLFLSGDSGYTYDTITTGIPAQDTIYKWIVPDTASSQCMLMIWAYGPGTGWDFTDSTFSIGVGISAGRSHKLKALRIYPNPSHGPINLDLPADVIQQISVFDAAGRRIRKLQPSPRVTLNLPPGIYFLQIKTQTQTKTEKLIILR